MGDLVNLNKARKARARDAARATAEVNRARYGRSRSERERDEAVTKRIAQIVDGARLEKD